MTERAHHQVKSMSRPPVPLGLLFPAVALLATPTAIAATLLVAAGMLDSLVAALTTLAVALAITVIVRPFLADLIAIRNAAEEIEHRGQAVKPRLAYNVSTPAELYEAVTRLHKSWLDARSELEDAVAANAMVLDRLPDPLLLLDPRRQVVRGNREARALFGANIAGRDLAAVLRNPAVLDAVDAMLAGQGDQTVEFELPVPVQRTFLASITGLPVATAEGVVAVLRLHDLTSIKRTEQMRADFVANVSHELKTPLASLIGYIETLRGPARDDKDAGERFLAIMEAQAQRMNCLVEDLLSLSRIELHEHTAPTGEVDLPGLLRQIAESQQARMEARGQRIELSFGEGPLVAVGDRTELLEVFENLLDNAIKYSGNDTTIDVTARRANRDGSVPAVPAKAPMIAVAVKDHGCGIAEEHLSRLTERFYRVDAARSRQLGGTGLGLAIVKHIVNRHRGELRIESELDVGSTFTVLLPAS
jgi:two-component system phosphate regulon sensor histidine kinase PhoR